tara:strand:- start:92 stop:388 length:297 start_codon:yes stop_codon:yes gene_type:complete
MEFIYALLNITVFLGACIITEKAFEQAYRKYKLAMRLAGIAIGLFALSICGRFFNIPIVIFRPPLDPIETSALGFQGGLMFIFLSASTFLFLWLRARP